MSIYSERKYSGIHAPDEANFERRSENPGLQAGGIYLSVVIPCYNEQVRFKKGFRHYFEYLNKQKYTWELIFVNDGSFDNTKHLIENKAKINKKIKSVSYQNNRGKGFAIAKGVQRAKGKYILFSDIDYSVPINTVESFFKYFEKGFKVVIGSRRVKGAKILVHQPAFREFLGRGFTALTRILIDFKILDATCGFKAFEASVAKKIFGNITIYDWAFDAEILFLCKKYNVKLVQAPVSWKNDRGSKVSLVQDVIKSLLDLVKIRINDLQDKY